MNRDLRTKAHGVKKHGNNTKDGEEPKLYARELRHDDRKEETDLKMKSQTRPRRITIGLLINVKGINVILHGLRPVPINR